MKCKTLSVVLPVGKEKAMAYLTDVDRVQDWLSEVFCEKQNNLDKKTLLISSDKRNGRIEVKFGSENIPFRVIMLKGGKSCLMLTFDQETTFSSNQFEGIQRRMLN